MKKCEHLMGRRDITRYDEHSLPSGEELHRACIRADNHHGPHLIKLIDGEYVIWQQDMCAPGECAGCDSEDPLDCCLIYSTVTSALELQKYLDDPKYVGLE